MKSRNMLRYEAKKLYKEQIKAQGISKKNRMPFAKFFKQYVENQKRQKQVEPDEQVEEDFDFENMINVNEISDDDVEVSEDKENS